MSLTTQQFGMAARIDARMKQLDALGFLEVEILAEMKEYLPDVHQLMMSATNMEMDALYEKYVGFFRFAKILETLASGIASGKIKVPDKKVVNKEHKIAAAIDFRVRQLEAKGITGSALLEQMVGHLPDFYWLWSTVSDEDLISLFDKYPTLYRYGVLMEEAAEVESKKEKTSYGHLPPLPDSVIPIIVQLMTDGATIERGLQTILDGQRQRDMWLEIEIVDSQHEYWVAKFAGLPNLLLTANVPRESQVMMMRIFEPMAERINYLHAQVFAKK